MFTEADLTRRRSIGDDATHEWICMLRARDPGHDVSTFVKKVVFHLHPSFANPIRTVETPPYEVKEIGWGEFELSVKIFFLDSDEKPVDCRHYLKLYPENTTDIRTIPPPLNFRDTCVASETIDEFVFRSPSPRLRELLSMPQRNRMQHPLTPFFLHVSNEDEDKYIAMTQYMQRQIIGLQETAKQEIQRKAQEIKVLMDIYYTLHPNQALNMLISNPSILRTLNVNPDVGDDELEAKIAEVRAAINNSKTSGKEKPKDFVKIFNDLVQDKTIAWGGCLSSLDFT